MTSTQQDKAALFRSLHHGERILILPNAWDVASARIIERAGAPAVATTSAGVAWSLGVPDGHKLARDQGVDVIARVAAAVRAPVTADIEGGYADDAEGVAVTIRMVIGAGAVGVNLEDGTAEGSLLPVEEAAERVAAARQAADATGVELYLNARTDVYLLRVGDPETRLKHAVERAVAYVAAGADGVFVPGVVDRETIGTLVREVGVPLNALGRGALPIPELAALGVARVSVGASIAEAAYTAARRGAEELLGTGTYGYASGSLNYSEINGLIAH
jgi:2-methylisocitrate lyase-like PEP mutase family enzyme